MIGINKLQGLLMPIFIVANSTSTHHFKHYRNKLFIFTSIKKQILHLSESLNPHFNEIKNIHIVPIVVFYFNVKRNNKPQKPQNRRNDQSIGH